MTPFRRVYITGFMGCGKTTAGKKLASALGYSFADLDHVIEVKEGRTIAQIFDEKGEAYFRKAEASALREMEVASDIVISTGGGTPCFGDNLSFMLNTGIVIYLRMTPQQLKSRLAGSRETRPLLKNFSDDEMVDYISEKLKEREPFYNRSSIIVDGMSLDIKLLCESINSFPR